MPQQGEPMDPLDEKLAASRERKLVAQGKLDGTVKPTFQTEAELQGFRPTQMDLGIGAGERPLDDLPMFGGELPKASDLCQTCGAVASSHNGKCPGKGDGDVD